MKLLNVRLNEDDYAKVKALRKEGVELSELIRESIRAEHAKRVARLTPARVEEIAESIFREHPDVTVRGPRAVDPTSRREVSAAISRRLRGTR